MAETKDITTDEAFAALVTDLSEAVNGLNEGARALAELLVECDRLKTVNAALLAALKDAVGIIKVWHSIHDADPDEEAWNIYRQHAPEMKRLVAAVTLAEESES